MLETSLEVEVKKILKEIRDLEDKIDLKQRYGNDPSQLVETVNRKIKILDILMRKEA